MRRKLLAAIAFSAEVGLTTEELHDLVGSWSRGVNDSLLDLARRNIVVRRIVRRGRRRFALWLPTRFLTYTSVAEIVQ